MASGGGDNDGPPTLQLLPQTTTPLPYPPPSTNTSTNTLTQNPNSDDDGSDDDGRPILLQLLPPPDPPSQSSVNPKLSPKPSVPKPSVPKQPKPKPVKHYKKTQPKKTETQTTPNPINLTQQDKIALAQKAKTTKWLSWLPKPLPTLATFHCLPHLLCEMHHELLKKGVMPVYDVYTQLPSKITENKRFNVKGETAYLFYGKRYQGKSAGKTSRKFRSADIMARWRNKGSWDVIAGQNGEVVGVHFFMVLEYMGEEASIEWTVDEYISVTSEVGDSSIVVLRCKDQKWNSVEVAVEKAEAELLGCHQQLLSARHEALNSEIGYLEALVFEAQIQLGLALTDFEKTRNALKSDQESVVKGKVIGAGGIEGIKFDQESCVVKEKVIDDVGIEGSVNDESLNLELGLTVGEGGCSLGGFGSYFLGLNKRKLEDNSRKANFKSSTLAGEKTALEDISSILVGKDTASAPIVPVPSTSYFSKRVQEMTSEGKNDSQK